ncbi:MAG: excinuclease ABC subunit UvrB [Candidatus ainarchaeum sp.]|nr:excinuclease ABC subunit UvrB [Candidatus ainarchaeum sp.]
MDTSKNKFELVSKFSPKGDQPKAIKQLSEHLIKNKDTSKNFQTLLGITGSGKTYSIAHVIEKYQKPTLVIAHNKTLAAQLYNEFKELFPNNKVEYFVSYYDYYQPESYVPQRDLYIEKNTKINDEIEKLRLSATASLTSRNDVIIVASVSCIYGLGNPKVYKDLGINLLVGQNINKKDFLKNLVDIQYKRNDNNLESGNFRVRGSTIDVIPAYYNNILRIEFFGDEIDRISEIDKLDNSVIYTLKNIRIHPAKHFVVPEEVVDVAVKEIKEDLDKRLPELDDVSSYRLSQRIKFDLEMIQEAGYCNGIENYSRYFDRRKPGERPFCLLDYFPKDFLLVIDESHQTLPQLRAMYAGDYSRKKNLVDYGFRLPSALDNRPLKFKEFEKHFMKNVIFVSATPSDYEKDNSSQIVEQIIRPTGLVDPPVEVRKTEGQVEDLIKEIKNTIKLGQRVLVTTLTKKLAEEISEFLSEKGIKTRYLHSEIDTLDRTEIIRQLRKGDFDCLVGINLLREGLDIPEVALIGILDADKEGFLRDYKSLIQIIGRAARNSESKVILYADRNTDSMKKAISETNRRRSLQIKYNKKNGIIPQTIIKKIPEKKKDIVKDIKHIPKNEISKVIKRLEKEMRSFADNLDFENAIKIRNQINALKERIK